MEQWRKDARREAVITDLEALVPSGHLLRKIEKVMDYEWLYERLDPYYCHDNGRPTLFTRGLGRVDVAYHIMEKMQRVFLLLPRNLLQNSSASCNMPEAIVQ